jgi:hypothetical protein
MPAREQHVAPGAVTEEPRPEADSKRAGPRLRALSKPTLRSNIGQRSAAACGPAVVIAFVFVGPKSASNGGSKSVSGARVTGLTVTRIGFAARAVLPSYSGANGTVSNSCVHKGGNRGSQTDSPFPLGSGSIYQVILENNKGALLDRVPPYLLDVTSGG